MLKDKIFKAVTALKNANSETDYMPLGIRGELEVIAKDRDGNVISYEKGHNQVTNFAKTQIIHLLAGEIGTLYNPVKTVECAAITFDTIEEGEEGATEVYCKYTPANHTATTNLDGTMLSELNYFSNHSETKVSQVNLGNLCANYPTKMLFGTGMEADSDGSIRAAYNAEVGATVSDDIINKLNGFSTINGLDTDFLKYKNSAENYYSSIYSGTDKLKARTLQPMTVTPLAQEDVAVTDTTIIGAIKDCLINSTGDTDKYDTTTGLVDPKYRGVGRPCYVYARRANFDSSFYNNDDSNKEVHYGVEASEGANKQRSVYYERELTYVVELPVQENNNMDIKNYCPYDGWILKQAGLFSDARYYPQSYYKALPLDTKPFKDSASGMLLFKRNLSSPILKTKDISITFIWHIFITV